MANAARKPRCSRVSPRPLDPAHLTPGVENLLVIFETLTGSSREATLAKFAGQGYGTLKREVAAVAVEKVGEIQQRYHVLRADDTALDHILASGAQRAERIASATLDAAMRATDYTAERLVSRANEDLANNIGNLVNRTVSMPQRYRHGAIPDLAADHPAADALRAARSEAAPAIDRALADFDFRRAAETVLRIGDEGNRYIETVRPWELAKAERNDQSDPAALDAVLAELVTTCRDLATHLQPLLPAFACRIAEQCGNGGTTVADPSPVFPRLETVND